MNRKYNLIFHFIVMNFYFMEFINKYNNNNKTVKHFPSSIREWDNSIYTYNTKSLKLIPYTTSLVNEMIKTYFSMYSHEIKNNIVLRYRHKKLSSNKIYISNGEYKHTNNKLTINIYTFNREKDNYILALRKLFRLKKGKELYIISNKHSMLKDKQKNKLIVKFKNKLTVKPKYKLIISPKDEPFIQVKEIINENLLLPAKIYLFIKNNASTTSKSYEQITANRIINPTKLDTFFYKKIKEIKEKGLNLLNLIRKEKHLIIKTLNLNNSKIYFNLSPYIINFYKKFVRNYLKKVKIYIFYRQLIFINKSKYNYNNLQYLTNFLNLIYNKNIEYNFINLKRFYLHSNIMSEAFTLKLKNNKSRMLRTLSKIKDKIKLKKNLSIMMPTVYYNNLISNNVIEKTQIRNKIIKNIKFKYMSGFKLQVKGRLTRRNKAARSVLKSKYKGTLLNISSSDKRLSTVLLKGNLNSNLQFTKLRSKSRIGSFGIKGWISGK